MQSPKYILLRNTPDGALSLFGHELEPLSEREARRSAERYILNTKAAGGDPEPLHIWRVEGAPVRIDLQTIADMEV